MPLGNTLENAHDERVEGEEMTSTTIDLSTLCTCIKSGSCRDVDGSDSSKVAAVVLRRRIVVDYCKNELYACRHENMLIELAIMDLNITP